MTSSLSLFNVSRAVCAGSRATASFVTILYQKIFAAGYKSPSHHRRRSTHTKECCLAAQVRARAIVRAALRIASRKYDLLS
jgi:hypothetical protein